jgi:catechol 2,3-dioxygenase-like lactoylglutathione lyase family enzyme
MKRFFFLLLFSTLLFVNARSQSKLGDVACVSITTPDLDSSVAFYSKLGFSKIASNEFPFPWAQVSDGSLLITLRKDNTPYIGLTYYVSDLDKVVTDLEKQGIEFAQKPKPGDPLKRYYIKSPDGFTIILANNLGGFKQPTGTTLLTMKPTDYNTADKYPNKLCGAFGEFAHPVADLKTSLAFWEKLGFKNTGTMNEPYPHAILSDGLMIIGLHQTTHFTYPAITYFGMNTEERIKQLKEKGLKNFDESLGKKNVILDTFEGQHFFIFSMEM